MVEQATAQEPELEAGAVEPPVDPESVSPPAAAIDVSILDDIQQVATPYPRPDYICPACEKPIPTHMQRRMNVPAKYEHELNQCFRCPFCRFVFSPKVGTVTLIKR